jgi:hypothetical protein
LMVRLKGPTGVVLEVVIVSVDVPPPDSTFGVNVAFAPDGGPAIDSVGDPTKPLNAPYETVYSKVWPFGRETESGAASIVKSGCGGGGWPLVKAHQASANLCPRVS